MICPNCGAKLKEDMLYCEVCGCEIQFVPEFEPVIEQSIRDTLSELNLGDDEMYYEDENSNEDSSYLDTENQDYYDEDLEYINDSTDEYVEEVDSEYYDEEEAIEEYPNDTFSEDYPDSDNEESLDGYYYDESTDSYYYYDSETDTYYYDEEYEDYDEEDEEFLGDPFDDFEYESIMLKRFAKFIKNSKAKWFIIAALLIVIGLVVFGVVKFSNYMYTHNSADYQTQQAKAAAAEGDYDTAIDCMERSLLLDSNNPANKYLLAEYYFSADEGDKAILMLWEIIKENDYNAADAYKKLISYYTDIQDYKMINEILTNCNDSAITDQFQSYMALAPEYSEQEGTYEEPVTVRLSACSAGTIYYTLDGSMPTFESAVYTDPIQLDELGIYTVTSFFVNQYGIQSDVTKKTYTIDIRIPRVPNVILEAGEYSTPHPIEVDVQRFTTVYYTTDGTAPNIFSSNTYEYDGPILMPLGHSHFIFVAYSQENICGDYAELEYDLDINVKDDDGQEVELDIEDITNKLFAYNFNTGKCSDLLGAVTGSSTHLKYIVQNAIALGPEDNILFTHPTTNETEEGDAEVSDYVAEEDMEPEDIFIYYIFEEKVEDSLGTVTKTDNLFLIDAKTLQIFKASKDDNGNIIKGSEITEEMYTPPEIAVSENAIPYPEGYDPNVGAELIPIG